VSDTNVDRAVNRLDLRWKSSRFFEAGRDVVKRLRAMLITLSCLLAGSAYAAGLTLTSPDLGGQLTETQVFSGFGCSGGNVSPALEWTGAPGRTKSFAVTMYDPDAPTGSGWWHWLVFNIPADTGELESDAGNPEKSLAPKGSIQSVTDFGANGFGGACPPEGSKPHTYIFTVYALDVDKLDLGADTTPALVGFMLNQHVLAKASLVAYYNR
jgi:Raf kinase inhibitor-like YbhB/YbcL family protein